MVKIGLQIHRVLSTDKLFCKCKAFKTSLPLEQFKVKIEDTVYQYFGKKNSFCYFEQDECPAKLNIKHVKKAKQICLRIPKIKLFSSSNFT